MTAAAETQPGPDPLRVLLLCDWFLKYTSSFGAGLARAGHSVSLLCRSHAFEFGGSAAERAETLAAARSAGVEVHELPGGAMSRNWLEALGVVRAIRALQPQVAHAQSAIFDPRFLLATGRLPLFLTIHDPVPHQGAPSRRRNEVLEAVWRRRADRLVVHSDRLVDDLGAAGKPIVVLPHGADVDDDPFAPPAEPSVLMFGRLEAYKGLDVLLRAMQLVWDTRPDVRLQVRGVGPAVRNLPDDPRIDARIGYVAEAELDAMFAAASLVVLPYTDASQSGVGTIALERGIPAIVSDLGGLPDLTVDDSFVVPPSDSEALAAAIVRHVDHDIGLRRRVLDLARSRFSWDAVARRAVGEYRRALRQPDEGLAAA